MNHTGCWGASYAPRVFTLKNQVMELKKLLSANVGAHHPEQALILTEKGEMFSTTDEWTAEGYPLVKVQTYDLEQLTTIVNNALRGKTMASSALVEWEAGAIHVSPVSNLYRVSHYAQGAALHTVRGGREGQQITLLGNGEDLLITRTGNLHLDGNMTLQNEYSVLLLQRVGSLWVEVTRTHNNS